MEAEEGGKGGAKGGLLNDLEHDLLDFDVGLVVVVGRDDSGLRVGSLGVHLVVERTSFARIIDGEENGHDADDAARGPDAGGSVVEIGRAHV